jgi:hypothetical protein
VELLDSRFVEIIIKTCGFLPLVCAISSASLTVWVCVPCALSLRARPSVCACGVCFVGLCVYVCSGGWVGGGWACVSCQRLVQVQKTEFDAIYHAFFDPTRLYSDGIRLKVFIT